MHSCRKMIIKRTSSYSLDWAPLTLFHSFVLILSSFSLLTIGVEDYCCTLSHSVTHIRQDFLDEGPVRRRDLSTCQHTTFTRERHPYRRRDSNAQSYQYIYIYVYIYIYTRSHIHTYSISNSRCCQTFQAVLSEGTVGNRKLTHYRTEQTVLRSVKHVME